MMSENIFMLGFFLFLFILFDLVIYSIYLLYKKKFHLKIGIALLISFLLMLLCYSKLSSTTDTNPIVFNDAYQTATNLKESIDISNATDYQPKTSQFKKGNQETIKVIPVTNHTFVCVGENRQVSGITSLYIDKDEALTLTDNIDSKLSQYIQNHFEQNQEISNASVSDWNITLEKANTEDYPNLSLYHLYLTPQQVKK